MSIATSEIPTIRKVPLDLSNAQHQVFWALSVIDEEALKNFFRAIRKNAVRPLLVNEINAELDKGIGFEEMFLSSRSILDITEDTIIELQVMWWGDDPLQCLIRVGEAEHAGSGAEWYVRFEPDGQVKELKFQYVWGDDQGLFD